MVFIHLPRVASSIASGLLQPVPFSASARLAITAPHIYRARAGIFDIDQFGHMNNAAYLVHCELARWQLSASTGLLAKAARRRMVFLVGATAIRYRRPISPFASFEVHTHITSWDEGQMFLMHTFVGAGPKPSVHASTLVRAIIKVPLLTAACRVRNKCPCPLLQRWRAQTASGDTVSPMALLAELSSPEPLEAPVHLDAAHNTALGAFSTLDEALRTSASTVQEQLRMKSHQHHKKD